MTENEIYEIAKKYIEEHLQQNYSVKISLNRLIEKKDGFFIYSYDCIDYLESESIFDSVLSNPIIVREEDGRVFETGSNGDTYDYIEHIKKYDNSELKFEYSGKKLSTLEEAIADELVDWQKKLHNNPDHFNEMITMIRYSIPFEDAQEYINQLNELIIKETNETILEVYRRLMKRLQEMV